MSGRQTAIVIGAGIAGLATAARLAAKGFHVFVFEKNSYAGGKLGLLQQDGYQFDTGPSLFTQPNLLEELFTDCGKQLSDYFTYKRVTEGTHYFWEDGTTLNAYANHQALAAEIKEQLKVNPNATLDYLQRAQKLYQNIGSLFLDTPLQRRAGKSFADIWKAIKTLRPAYLFQTLHKYNEHQLKHPKLIQLFDRFATYNGSNPYQCPAMMSMIAHLELNEGAFYPKGGMISIPQAVKQLCDDLGVQFHFNTAVEEIIREQDKVKGIVANGKQYLSDIVISNSDIYFTYKKLLHDEAAATRIQRQERSSSGIIFYWGIRKTFPQLHLHNIFFSDNYKAEFNALFHQQTLFAAPTIYINITSKLEQQHAPAGCENWFILINAPHDSGNAAAQAAQMKRHILDKLSRMLHTDIAPLIATESILTQQDIATQTGSYLGALYGTASNTRNAAFLRQPNYSKKYKGLYFAGGTVHPGGGIPLCLRSARIAASLIQS